MLKYFVYPQIFSIKKQQPTLVRCLLCAMMFQTNISAFIISYIHYIITCSQHPQEVNSTVFPNLKTVQLMFRDSLGHLPQVTQLVSGQGGILTQSYDDWIRASLVAQPVKNLPAMQKTQFNSWVGKISWRRDKLPTAVFLGFPSGSAG